MKPRTILMEDRIRALLGAADRYRNLILIASPSLVRDLDLIAQEARRVGCWLHEIPPTLHPEEDQEIRLRVLSALRGQFLEALEEDETEPRLAVARKIEACYNPRRKRGPE